MSVSYFVRYSGRAPDEGAFVEHYRTRHAALLGQLPGLRSLVLHRPLAWRDPFPVTPDGTLLLAQMSFDDGAALDRALASQARAAARDDFANFPPFEGTVSHQALRSEVLIG